MSRGRWRRGGEGGGEGSSRAGSRRASSGDEAVNLVHYSNRLSVRLFICCQGRVKLGLRLGLGLWMLPSSLWPFSFCNDVLMHAAASLGNTFVPVASIREREQKPHGSNQPSRFRR
jgi:hypothetical protein